MYRGRVYATDHSFHLFPLPKPAFTSVSGPYNCAFDDDIDWVADNKAALAYIGEVGGKGGDGSDVGLSGAGFEAGSLLLGSFGAIPPEEEQTPLLTWSHTWVGFSGFDATDFY